MDFESARPVKTRDVLEKGTMEQADAHSACPTQRARPQGFAIPLSSIT